jgi:hypothetical protein
VAAGAVFCFLAGEAEPAAEELGRLVPLPRFFSASSNFNQKHKEIPIRVDMVHFKIYLSCHLHLSFKVFRATHLFAKFVYISNNRINAFLLFVSFWQGLLGGSTACLVHVEHVYKSLNQLQGEHRS